MKARFTLKFWSDDMGSFTQPGCTSLEDALWHINSAREHDGLPAMDMQRLKSAFSPRNARGDHAEKKTEN